MIFEILGLMLIGGLIIAIVADAAIDAFYKEGEDDEDDI
jgi:hypothetical protein